MAILGLKSRLAGPGSNSLRSTGVIIPLWILVRGTAYLIYRKSMLKSVSGDFFWGEFLETGIAFVAGKLSLEHGRLSGGFFHGIGNSGL